MIDVLEAVRRVVYRWAKTATPISAPLFHGDTVVNVQNSIRFQKGDEVAIHNGREVEYFTIENIPNNNQIFLDHGVESTTPWSVEENTFVEKCYKKLFVQGIYIGETNVIIKYPAITIMGTNRSSDWYAWTLTKERYEVDISIYVEDSTNEDGYYFLESIAQTVQKGLKKNIFPLVGETQIANILFDLNENDMILKVNDSSLFPASSKVLLEDMYKSEELRVAEVMDSTTLRVFPNVKNSFRIADETKLIKLSRFIHKSWPSSIDYGFIHKNTLLKAAKISWYGEEMEPQQVGGWSDPQLS